MKTVTQETKLAMTMQEENLGYMSDMALELAQMAEESGLTTLAYLFRMAALEAATAGRVATPEIAQHVTH
ncbi:hypothetical protein C2U70_30770 [Bradyrhizobium guangdongense]|uniref:hypothetical protein n=1 Tax=Bradyrhizobium guangdongense TaxID=1325090 RepID=UPI0011272D4A|nr:hypothetical protein [Bradyrhizobium guangdongense]TPQ27420.1 hypothetical protein C2U70_30770 [Bradyrhizobium guangdongense]